MPQTRHGRPLASPGMGRSRRGGSNRGRGKGPGRGAGAIAVSTLLLSAPLAGPAGAATPTAAVVATPPLLTSLLSPRRLPNWLENSAAQTRLAATVASVPTPTALGAAAPTTCAVVMQGDQVLASINPTMPLIPASN